LEIDAMGFSDFDRTTSSTKAVAAAKEYATQLKSVPACGLGGHKNDCTRDDYRTEAKNSEFLMFVIERLAPAQRSVFLYELGRQMGGTRAFTGGGTEIRVTDPSTLNQLKWFPEPNLAKYVWDNYTGNSWPAPKGPRTYPGISAPGLEEYDHYDAVKVAGIISTPLTNYVVKEGWNYTLSWQVFKETSKSNGQEGYVDVYVSIEEGAKVGLNLPVISFSVDVKTGMKRGQKIFNKDETKNAVRSGSTVSQSFVLQKLMRNVKIYSQIGGHSGFETGYIIERKDGGDPLGPFWPDYSSDGFPVDDTALPKAKAAMTTLMEESAIELAKQSGR